MPDFASPSSRRSSRRQNGLARKTNKTAKAFELQPLEDRLLFSANTGTISNSSLDAATVKSVNSGIQELVKMGDALDQYGALASQIAGVGQSIGGLFDLGSSDGTGGFLGTQFGQQLSTYLKGASVDSDGVKAFLTSLTATKASAYSLSVENVVGGYYADTKQFEWELTLKATKNGTFTLSPGSDLAAEGLSISAPTLNVATDVAFRFSFGVNSDGTGFFLTFSDLDLDAKVDTGNTVNFGVDFTSGGSFSVKNGSVSATANVDNVTFKAGTGAGGRVTLSDIAQFTDGLTATEVSYSTPTGTLKSVLPLDAIATGFPTVLIDDSNVFDATAPDVTIKYYLTDATLQSQILSILGEMDTVTSSINADAILNQKLPVINESLADLLPSVDFSTLLSLKDVAQTYFASTPTPELPGLVKAMTDHFASVTGMAKDAITGVFDASTRQIQFGFDLEANPETTANIKIDRFGEAATELGLTVPDIEVSAQGSTKAAFTIGVDLTDSNLTSSDFYLKVTDISAGVKVNATGLDFGVTVGPLDAAVKGGSIALDAKGALTISDPNSDGRISVDEFGTAAITLTPSGNLDVKLPLQMSFGGYDFKAAGVDPYLRIYSTNPFTTRPVVDATTPNFSRIFDLGKMGPQQVLDLIVSAGDWAEQFRDSSVFDIDIPFLKNVDLGDAFDFGLLFAKNLQDNLTTNEVSLYTQTPTLNLASATAFKLVINDDLATAKMVTLAAGNYSTPAALAAALNTAITAAYGANPPVTAVVNAGADRKLNTADDKVQLVSDPDTVPSFTLLAPLTNLKNAGFYSGSTTATLVAPRGGPADGKLASDASMTVSIDGGSPISVTLAASSTTDNKSVADLAKDLDAAFEAKGITTVNVTESGGKLVFTGTSAVSSFVLLGVGATGWGDLGLNATNSAGLGSVGSTAISGPKFTSFQTLVPMLASALGIDESLINPTYDPATETIKLHVEFGYNPDPIQVPVGFNLNVADLAGISTVDANGNPADFNITLTPKLNAKLDFGYSFNPSLTAEAVSIAPAIGYVSPAGYDPNAATLTPKSWNGRLVTGDAVFTIVLDDAVSRTLTVTKASTSTNTSMADLVADINAAIAANAGLNGKIVASLIPAAGETSARVQISTVAGSSQSLHLKTTATNAAAVDLGFAPDSYATASTQTIAVTNLAGQKVTYAPGADATFNVSIDGGATTAIKVLKTATDGNTSLADLLADINSAIKTAGLSSKLVATQFGTGDRIEISTIGNVRTLRFDADTTDPAVTKLGFSDQEVFSRLRGGSFFIDNAQLSAEATISVDDLRLKAQLGFIGISTGDSSGEIKLGATADLKDGSNNTKFEIGTLFGSLARGDIGSMVQLTPTGSANFSLTNIKVDAGLFVVPGAPTIGFVIDDLFPSGGLTVTPVFQDMPSLTNFKKLDFNAIFLAVKQGVELLSNYSEFGFLNNKIPVINLSATEILDYADKLRLAVEQMQADPASALQFVESKIEEVFNLPANLVHLSVEGPNLDTIKLSLTLDTTYSTSFGLDLDLSDLASLFPNGQIPAGLDTITDLIDAQAKGNIDLAAYAEVKLDLGLDLSGSSATPFLYDTSGLEFGLRLAGRNLDFNANIGIVGLAVTGGTVLFDSDGQFDVLDKDGNPVQGGDGVIDDDYATIRFGLKDNLEPGSELDGRHYFTEDFTAADDFEVTFNGQFQAVLPAAVITPIGNIDLDQPITLTTTATDFSNLIQRIPGTSPIKITAPNIKDLLPDTPGLLQLLRDPSILLDGVDGALFRIQTALDSQTSQKLPLIGDRMAEGAQVIENFREGFLASLTNQLRGAGDNLLQSLRQEMFSFFDGTLGILQDYDGKAGITVDDIVLTFRKADGSLWVDGVDAPSLQDAVQFNFHLGKAYIADIPDLSLDFSIPGLALDVSGSPSVGISWDFYFGFGVSISDLFYLDAKPTTDGQPKNANNDYVDNELEVNFDVKLTSDEANPFTAKGQLFFLQLQATDLKLMADNTVPSGNGGSFSYFNGKFAVNLQDPGTGANADDRVTFSELFKKGTTPVLQASLSAKADVNLGLDLSIEGSSAMPRILADFNLDWAWTAGQAAETPKVGFNNVKLDLGSFVSDFLGPIATQLNDIIKPFDPVLDALQTRIPVLSELMGRDYTILDLAAQFGHVDRRFVDAVLQIRGLIADIADAAASGENIIIDIGSIADLGSSLMSKGGASNVDPTQLGISTTAITTDTSTKTGSVLSKASTVSGGGFGFPILKPSNIFKLLLGQDVTLFTYDIPRLEVGMSMSAKFSIFGPLVATFSGKISAFADFAVGFDTKGLNQFKTSGDPLDILDGFYVSDMSNPDGTGVDVPEAGFTGRIDIGGAVNLAVVEAGISGFFQITANLDLNDPNDDGKIRGSEILALLKYQAPDGNYYGPLNLGSINLKGEVGARAYVDFWAPFDWYNAWEYEFFRTTLFDVTFSAPKPQPALAQVSSGGVLTLNSGANASNRVFGSTSDVGEDFTLVETAPGVIQVTFNNTLTTQTYTGVSKIVINAGKGNDVIDASQVNVFVELYGGEGDDVLKAGTGGSLIDGGDGSDEIYGGSGDDRLIGGKGADTISGGAGDDYIEGGEGRDEIEGGDGNDTYFFADNWGADVLDLQGNADAGNRDTLDFGGVTANLSINVGSNVSKITAGKNTLSAADPVGEIQLIKGGSGADAITINATSTGGISVDGGKGEDSYFVGLGRLNGTVNISDTDGAVTDNDTIIVQPLTADPIGVYDGKLTSDKGKAGTELVNFDQNIESLTIDAAKNSVSVKEALDFEGNVRIKAQTAVIPFTVNAGYIRVDSINTIDIAADLNARRNGNVEVVVGKGDIHIDANVLSTAGATGAVGDGSGVIQLISRGGQILADGTGLVRADEGYLLLLGTTGSIGTVTQPILTQVKVLAANTTGSGVINIQENDGVTIDEVAIIKGITSNGGDVIVTNLANSLTFNQPANARSGDMTFTSDQVQVNADLLSPNGDLILQPLHTDTPIAIADGVDATFDLNTDEMAHLVDGFNSVKIGRADGTHAIYVADVTLNDPTYLRDPILGGHVYQTGSITGSGTLTILGSGHTTTLGNQHVTTGNIDIVDSVQIPEGDSVRLEADNGNININFDVDGTAGGLGETLTLNAPNGNIIIKGAIGSLAKLQNLIIENALSVTIEGMANIGSLVIQNVPVVSIDGIVNAESIELQTVSTVTFKNSVTATTGISHTTGTLGSAIFQGPVTTSSLDLTATTLLDFYQNVGVDGDLTLQTTGLAGNITLRQQVNVSGDITVTSLQDITFMGPVTATNVTVAGADDVAFQSTLDVSGTLTQVTGTGTSTFGAVTAGIIDLTNEALTFNSTITTTNGAGALSLNATSGAISVTGAVLAAGTFDATASGNITFTASLTADSIALAGTNITTNALTATDGDITVSGGTSSAVAFNGAISADAGSLLVSQAGSVTFSAGVSADAASISATNTITVANNATFDIEGNASFTTTSTSSGEIRFTGPFLIGGDATISSARALSFLGAVDVTGALAVTRATTVQYQAAVNVGGLFSQGIQVTGATSFSADVNADSADLRAASFAFSTDFIVTNDATLNAATGAVSISGSATVGGTFTIGQASAITVSGTTAAGAVVFTASNTITFGSGGVSSETGSIVLTTLLAGIGNSVTVNGPVLAATLLDINAARGVALNGTVDAVNATIDGARLSTQNRVAITEDLTVNVTGDFVAAAELAIGGVLSVPQVRDLSFNGIVTADTVVVGATAARNISVGASGLTATNAISFKANSVGGSITLTGPVTSSDGVLTLTTVGSLNTSGALNANRIVGSAAAMTFNGTLTADGLPAGLSSIVLDGAGSIVLNNAVTSANDLRIGETTAPSSIALSGAVTVSNDVVLAAVQSVTVNSVVNAGGDVVVSTTSAAAGEIRFVSALTTGADLVVTAARDAIFQAAVNVGGDVLINTVAALHFQAPLVIVGSLTQLAGTGTASYASINAASAAINAQAISITNGLTTLTGDATLTAAANGDVTVNGTVSVDGALSVTRADDVSFGGAVTAASVDVGSVQARVITFATAGLTASGDITLRANVAGGSVTLNGPTQSATGTLTIDSVGAFVATSLDADRIVGTAASMTVSGTVKADGLPGGTSGIVLNAASAGNGTFSFGATVTSADDILIGVTTRPAIVTFSATVQAQEDLSIKTSETVTANGALIALTGDLTLVTTSSIAGQIRVVGNITAGHDFSLTTLRDAVFEGAATVGGDATIQSVDDLQFLAALTVTGDLLQVSGTGVSSFAAVSAASVDLTTNTVVVANTLTATTGGITFATVGNITVTGATTAAQALHITQASAVTLQGAVSASEIIGTLASFLGSNTLTTTSGDLDLTATGNIRVVGLTTIADDLIIRGAANVEFQGQVNVTDAIQQIDGTGTTRFDGVTQAASISLRAAQQVLAGSAFRALTGNILIESDEIDFIGGTNTVQGNADLILRPYLASTTIDVGSPTPSGTLDISDVDLNALRDGFTQITIGRSEDATGAMVIGSSIFKDNVVFYAGSITVEQNNLVGQQVTSLESLEMVARTGSIQINDDIDATDVTIASQDAVTANATVQGQSFVLVNAGTDGTGSIIVTAAGSFEATADGSTTTLVAGATSGNITIAGKIAADEDVTLTAVAGSITQTAGNTSGHDLIVLARSGITLLTTVDHITARVTGTGDMVITDTNPDPLHFVDLGSKTDVNDGLFTANGSITFNSDQNANAYRVIANGGGVFINVAGDVYIDNIQGSPTQVTGTILLDENRTTNGSNIVFTGNIRLLRDITLTSNGGDIIITGKVSGTFGQEYGLTLNAGTGDISIGGPIGASGGLSGPLKYLTVVSADDVAIGTEQSPLGSIRVINDIEIHANAIDLFAPRNSVETLNGGALRLLPLDASASIDIGAPRNGSATFSLDDSELAAFKNGFSLITIGQTGGDHDITIESAQFRDSLVLNGDNVSLLTSSVPQGVSGLSVVNGDDDNSITINAQSSFTQGTRAAITGGRFGDITITADEVALDALNRNMIRSFGDLILQPFSANQAITLGSTGTADDFDLTAGEINTLADGFHSITIGRADGQHAIVIDGSLQFRDSVTIQAPLGAGSISYGALTTRLNLQTVSRGDSLTLLAADNIEIDGAITTVGSSVLNIFADADHSGAGDLLIGSKFAGSPKTPVAITSRNGAVNLQGENVSIGRLDANPKLGGVQILSQFGNIAIHADLNGDANGAISILNPRTRITTGGAASFTSGGNIAVGAGVRFTIGSTLGFFADRDDATDDGNVGTLTIGSAVKAKARGVITLSAFTVQVDPTALLVSPQIVKDQG